MKTIVDRLIRWLPMLRVWSHCSSALALLLLCATVAWTQGIPAVPSTPPPGSIGTDAALATGWLFYLFGFLVIVFILVALATMAHHPGIGWTAVAAAIIFGILAGNAAGIARLIYHPTL